MTKIKGKAADLNLQPGDVVECVDDARAEYWTEGKRYTVTSQRGIVDDDGDDFWKPETGYPTFPTFRIVSRAADRAESPTLLRDMTDAEVGALWRAFRDGKEVQEFIDGAWVSWCLVFMDHVAYRVKPEPETVTLYGSLKKVWGHSKGPRDTHSITMPRNLKPGTYTGPDGNVIEVVEL